MRFDVWLPPSLFFCKTSKKLIQYVVQRHVDVNDHTSSLGSDYVLFFPFHRLNLSLWNFQLDRLDFYPLLHLQIPLGSFFALITGAALFVRRNHGKARKNACSRSGFIHRPAKEQRFDCTVLHKEEPNNYSSNQTARKDDRIPESNCRTGSAGSTIYGGLHHQVVGVLQTIERRNDRSARRHVARRSSPYDYRAHAKENERRKGEEKSTNGNRGRRERPGTGIESRRKHVEMAPGLAIRPKLFHPHRGHPRNTRRAKPNGTDDDRSSHATHPTSCRSRKTRSRSILAGRERRREDRDGPGSCRQIDEVSLRCIFVTLVFRQGMSPRHCYFRGKLTVVCFLSDQSLCILPEGWHVCVGIGSCRKVVFARES